MRILMISPSDIYIYFVVNSINMYRNLYIIWRRFQNNIYIQIPVYIILIPQVQCSTQQMLSKYRFRFELPFPTCDTIITAFCKSKSRFTSHHKILNTYINDTYKQVGMYKNTLQNSQCTNLDTFSRGRSSDAIHRRIENGIFLNIAYRVPILLYA